MTLTTEERVRNYRMQTPGQPRRELTARQLRRIKQKENRAK